MYVNHSKRMFVTNVFLEIALDGEGTVTMRTHEARLSDVGT